MTRTHPWGTLGRTQLEFRRLLERKRSSWLTAGIAIAGLAATDLGGLAWLEGDYRLSGLRLFLLLLPLFAVAATLSFGAELCRPFRWAAAERGYARVLHGFLWAPTMLALLVTVGIAVTGASPVVIEASSREAFLFLSFFLWPQYLGIPVAIAHILGRRGRKSDRRITAAALLSGPLLWFFWANVAPDAFDDAPWVALVVAATAVLGVAYYRIHRPAPLAGRPALDAPSPDAMESGPTYERARL